MPESSQAAAPPRDHVQHVWKRGDPTPLNMRDWQLGTWLQVATMDHGTTRQFTGQFYAFDGEQTGLLVLQAPHDLPENRATLAALELGTPGGAPARKAQRYDLFACHTDSIVSIANLSQARAGARPADRDALVRLGDVVLDRLVRRERDAIDAERARRQRAQQGVADAGERIFAALSKTLPCQWAGPEIVVMQEVRIGSPYTSSSARLAAQRRGDSNAGKLLERVRMVLDREWQRLGAP